MRGSGYTGTLTVTLITDLGRPRPGKNRLCEGSFALAVAHPLTEAARPRTGQVISVIGYHWTALSVRTSAVMGTQSLNILFTFYFSSLAFVGLLKSWIGIFHQFSKILRHYLFK